MRSMLMRGDVAYTNSARLLRIGALLCVLFAALFVALTRRMPYAMATALLLPAAFVLLLIAVLLVFTARRYDARDSQPSNR
jgi:hypothetical protein